MVVIDMRYVELRWTAMLMSDDTPVSPRTDLVLESDEDDKYVGRLLYAGPGRITKVQVFFRDQPIDAHDFSPPILLAVGDTVEVSFVLRDHGRFHQSMVWF